MFRGSHGRCTLSSHAVLYPVARVKGCFSVPSQPVKLKDRRILNPSIQRMLASTNDDRLSPCIASAICEARVRAVLVAGSGRTGLRRRSGMDDGDTSTVNEEKQRCSLP